MDLDILSDKENVNTYMNIIKVSLAESKFYDSTKKEVLRWLSTANLDGSKSDSSYSRDCVSTGSRKSGIRSGDSSLESNLQTPIKRRKLATTISVPSTVRRTKHAEVLKNQPRIDQYFLNEEEQLQTTKGTLSSSENSPRTPVKNTENMILPGKDSYNERTPDRKSIPVNSVPRKNAALPKRRFVAKTPVDFKNLGESTNNAKKENGTNLGTSKSNCSTALSENSRNIGTLEIISVSDEEDQIENPSSNDCIISEINVSSNDLNLKNNDLGNSDIPTMLNEEQSYQKIVQRFCDLKYDSDDSISDDWKRNKVSSYSPSNSSEFNPEEKVSPVNTKVKLPVSSISVEQSTSPHINMQSVRKSFLASLSNDVPLENADLKAVNYRTNYKSLREELCKELYALYNEKVFDNKLPKDLPIEWSVRLQRTAGKYKSSKSLEKASSSSRILLSTKILNSPNRLRDVLIHEMCHAATKIINHVRDGHGSIWKAWASKAVEVFPELPTITRCHSYETQKKVTYRCTCCGHSFGRHRRSFDINIKMCGYCYGPFEILIKNVTKAGKVQVKHISSTKQPKSFAVYVKENFHAVRQRETSIKHAEVIKILKQQFCAIKATS